MQEQDRETLRRNRTFLVKELEPKLVYDYLVEHGIYNDIMLEDIRAEKTRFDQATKLLTSLTRRGRDAFRVFCEALEESGQYEIADRLQGRSPEEGAAIIEAKRREEANRRKQTAQLYGYSAAQAQPSSTATVHTSRTGQVQPSSSHDDTQWPEPDESGLFDVKRLLKKCIAPRPPSPREYPMTKKPRGYAFILNNKYFKGLPLREGTEKDADNLKNLFRELSFITETYQNLNTADIHEKLNQFAQKNHQDFECCVVALLSHGGEGGIFGTDSGLIRFDEILQKFDGENCSGLIGKPKLFFIQACRGDDKDQGVPSSDSRIPGSTSPSQSDATVASPQQVFAPNVPTISDAFLAYATLPGYVSWRNSQRGSWFICALVEVFLMYAATKDINQLMTDVNHEVSQRTSSSTSYRQMPAPVNMLTKNLYFNPGIGLSSSDTTEGPHVSQESSEGIRGPGASSHGTAIKNTRVQHPTD